MKRVLRSACLAAALGLCAAAPGNAQVDFPIDRLPVPGMEDLGDLFSGSADFETLVETLLPVLEMLGAMGLLVPERDVASPPRLDPEACQDAIDDPAALAFALPMGGTPAGLEQFDNLEQMDRLFELMGRMPSLDECMLSMLRIAEAGILALRGDLSGASAIYDSVLPPLGDDAGASRLLLLSHASHAALMVFQRRDDEAEALFEALLPQMERKFGSDAHETLAVRGAIADLKMNGGEIQVALEAYEALGAILTRALGSNAPLVCVNRLSQAEALMNLDRSDQAVPILRDVLDPSDPACGPLLTENHPWWARALRLRGTIYLRKDDFARANRDFTAALSGAVTSRGETSPQSLAAMFSLVELPARQGNIDAAIAMLDRLDDKLLAWLGREIRGSARRSARRGLISDQRRFQELALRLALAYPSSDALAGRAAEAMLRYKGMQGEEEAALSRLLRSPHVDADVRELAQEVARLRSLLSAEFNRLPSDAAATGPVDIARVVTELEAAEDALARASDFFSNREVLRLAGVSDIQDALKARSRRTVLVEFRIIEDRDWGDVGVTAEGSREILVAVVIDAESVRVLELRSLGEIDTIGQALTNDRLFQPSSTEAGNGVARDPIMAQFQRNLFRLLIEPLDIADYEEVILAPDGALNLLPFWSMRDEIDRHWVEHPTQNIAVAGSGRTLLVERHDERFGILGFGGIEYGSGEFRFLPESEKEVRTVVEIYRRQTDEPGPPRVGSSATETLLKSLKSPPKVLHLATHGFFEPRPDQSPASVRRPLVLSGVALAGATFTGEASSDGILYAIEAQDLNLEGTELVVLSACKSAQGYIEKGEGVHGLTRAFGIAGARQMLVALRPVDDAEAALFSETFYREWLGGGGSPSDAFQATLQTILSKWPHLDWTAYALFGVAEGS